MSPEFRRLFRLAPPALICAVLLACSSSSVEDTTYAGGPMSIHFKSGGKADVSTGLGVDNCNWSQDGKKVTLTCQNDPVVLTLDDDGGISGPEGSFITRLVKKQ